jgi:hypothetical protein
MAIGSHVDGSDPSREFNSFTKKPLNCIMWSSPHLSNCMETPSNFAVIVFTQATSREVLWKPPRVLNEHQKGRKFYTPLKLYINKYIVQLTHR